MADPDGPGPDELASIHAEVDRDARRLAEHHGDRLKCRLGCTDCCVDGITVFEVEAERIREHHAELLEHGTPHPEGACAFLGSRGECRVYRYRPYVCRTQGLPLRWIQERDDGSHVEMRDICPLNEEGEPIEALPQEVCWSLGPVEARLATLQARSEGAGAWDPGGRRRVALRDLFHRT